MSGVLSVTYSQHVLSEGPCGINTLHFVSQEFPEELDHSYPCPFWLEAISVELMTALEVYAVRGPELEPIPCHAVADLALAFGLMRPMR